MADKLNILILADVFYPDTTGGAGRVAYLLSKELVSNGHSISVVTRNPDTRYQSYQMIEGISVYRFPTPSNESFDLVYSEIKGSYSVFKRVADRTDFDLVCVHQCMAAIGPSFNRLFRELPLIYFFHSPWSIEFLTKRKANNGTNSTIEKAIAGAMHYIEKHIISKALKIVTLSNFMGETALSIHRKLPEQVRIIPPGVDLDHFKLKSNDDFTIKNRLRLPADKTIFLTVRNLVPRMGIENLIECFHTSDSLKDKAFLIIGGAGFHQDHLLSLVKYYGLQPHIRFWGYIPEEMLPEIYQAADFFILPTAELEGFGLVILESMACGTPVLGTPVGAIPEILNQFDERLIFEGTDCYAMRFKLEQVIKKSSPYVYDPMDCRCFVEQNYSWRKMADAFENEAFKIINPELNL